jgi:hypothetical protein
MSEKNCHDPRTAEMRDDQDKTAPDPTPLTGFARLLAELRGSLAWARLVWALRRAAREAA